MAKFQAVVTPCNCEMMDGHPHYHVDSHTVIPWPELERALAEYRAKGFQVSEIEMDPPRPMGVSMSVKKKGD